MDGCGRASLIRAIVCVQLWIVVLLLTFYFNILELNKVGEIIYL